MDQAEISARQYESAMRLAIEGRTDQAIRILQGLHTLHPSSLPVQESLAKLMILAGRPGEAAPYLSTLEQRSHKDADACLVLAEIFLQSNRVSDADVVLNRATELSTGWRPHRRLVETAIRSRRRADAAASFEKAAASGASFSDLIDVAGPLFLLLGDEARLAKTLATMVATPPEHKAQLFDGWAEMLSAGGWIKEAAYAASKAIDATPQVERYCTYADLLLTLRDVKNAQSAVAAALDMAPQNPHALVTASRCAVYQGKNVDAVSLLRRALQHDPHNISAFDYLSQLDAPSITSDDTARFEKMARQSTSPIASSLSLALARIYENRHDFQKAYDYFVEAKAQLAESNRLAGKAYSARAIEKLAESVIKKYNARSQFPTKSPTAPRMIFILGMPRSGTSLVEQILASHPDVYGGGELPMMIGYLNESLAVRPDDLKSMTPAQSIEIRTRYVEALPERSRSEKVVTDKHPLNFWAIGLIKSAFPDSAIIHCVRPPLDVCWSVFRAALGPEYSFAADFDSLAHYYAAYERIMAHWREIYEEEIYDLDYQALISRPEDEIRSLLTFCALSADPACFEHHKSTREVQTLSAAQANKPISAKYADMQKNYSAYLEPLRQALKKRNDAFPD